MLFVGDLYLVDGSGLGNDIVENIVLVAMNISIDFGSGDDLVGVLNELLVVVVVAVLGERLNNHINSVSSGGGNELGDGYDSKTASIAVLVSVFILVVCLAGTDEGLGAVIANVIVVFINVGLASGSCESFTAGIADKIGILINVGYALLVATYEQR
jgi:hypothetical protein